MNLLPPRKASFRAHGIYRADYEDTAATAPIDPESLTPTRPIQPHKIVNRPLQPLVRQSTRQKDKTRVSQSIPGPPWLIIANHFRSPRTTQYRLLPQEEAYPTGARATPTRVSI
jgi:hypothetical protein